MESQIFQFTGPPTGPPKSTTFKGPLATKAPRQNYYNRPPRPFSNTGLTQLGQTGEMAAAEARRKERGWWRNRLGNPRKNATQKAQSRANTTRRLQRQAGEARAAARAASMSIKRGVLTGLAQRAIQAGPAKLARAARAAEAAEAAEAAGLPAPRGRTARNSDKRALLKAHMDPFFASWQSPEIQEKLPANIKGAIRDIHKKNEDERNRIRREEEIAAIERYNTRRQQLDEQDKSIKAAAEAAAKAAAKAAEEAAEAAKAAAKAAEEAEAKAEAEAKTRLEATIKSEISKATIQLEANMAISAAVLASWKLKITTQRGVIETLNVQLKKEEVELMKQNRAYDEQNESSNKIAIEITAYENKIEQLTRSQPSSESSSSSISTKARAREDNIHTIQALIKETNIKLLAVQKAMEKASAAIVIASGKISVKTAEISAENIKLSEMEDIQKGIEGELEVLKNKKLNIPTEIRERVTAIVSGMSFED